MKIKARKDLPTYFNTNQSVAFSRYGLITKPFVEINGLHYFELHPDFYLVTSGVLLSKV